MRSLFTSSIALFNFSLARFSVSSTDIKTCSSSLKCSQLGLPLFCSSLKHNFVWLFKWSNVRFRTFTYDSVSKAPNNVLANKWYYAYIVLETKKEITTSNSICDRTYLLFITHRTLSSNHNFASGLQL